MAATLAEPTGSDSRLARRRARPSRQAGASWPEWLDTCATVSAVSLICVAIDFALHSLFVPLLAIGSCSCESARDDVYLLGHDRTTETFYSAKRRPNLKERECIQRHEVISHPTRVATGRYVLTPPLLAPNCMSHPQTCPNRDARRDASLAFELFSEQCTIESIRSPLMIKLRFVIERALTASAVLGTASSLPVSAPDGVLDMLRETR